MSEDHQWNSIPRIKMTARRHGRRSIAYTLACSLALSGCAANGGGNNFGGKPVVDPADECSLHRQPIADIQRSTYSEEDALTALLVGAGTGVLVGALSGNWKAGLGAGVALGGGTAIAQYISNKNQIAKDQTALLNSIDTDAASDGRSLNRIQGAVSDLRSCRKRQFQQLADDVRAGRMAREQARTRYLTLIDYRKRDDEIVNAVLGVAKKRASLYTEARMQTMKTDRPDIALAAYEVPNNGPPVPVKRLRRAATLRAERSSTAAGLADLSVGAEVEVLGHGDGWTEVGYEGKTGFVPDSTLRDTGATRRPHPTRTVPEVGKLVDSVKATEKVNETSTHELDVAQDNLRTLLS